MSRKARKDWTAGKVGTVGKGGDMWEHVGNGEIGVKLVENGVDLVKFYVEINENQKDRAMTFNCDRRADTLSVLCMCAVAKTNSERCVVYTGGVSCLPASSKVSV